jgi:hypothetical protein
VIRLRSVTLELLSKCVAIGNTELMEFIAKYTDMGIFLSCIRDLDSGVQMNLLASLQRIVETLRGRADQRFLIARGPGIIIQTAQSDNPAVVLAPRAVVHGVC